VAALIARRLVLAAVVLAGCSSGGESKGETTTTADVATNRARAGNLVFQASDFPSGWTQVKDEGQDARDQDKEFRTCLGLGADEPEASSTFGKDDALASSEINVAASADVAADELALFAGEKGSFCLEEALTKIFSKVAPPEIIRVSVGRLKLPAQSESSVAYRAVVRIGTEDTVAIYADVIAIRQGSLQASISFSNVGKPVPESLEKSLLAKLADRMAG
jgi:hypothetical protein